MPDDIIDRARRYHDELTEFRRDIHAHPELGLEEHRTAERVASKLAELGIEVHRGVGKTGVVGVLRNGDGPSIGLRADMDALPIHEETNLPYSSRNAGLMHACGHDGHTTMLLGAAKYLADTKNFKGTVNFIFQPGEEGIGGALAMLNDRLFERFPCDAIFGMHNRPGMPVGQYAISPGVGMAGGAFFDITITGKGAHGARPEESVDPVLVACHLGTALQSIVARNVPPQDIAVLSVTRILSGDAYNVIPQTATLAGTVRTMKRETMQLVEANMKRLASHVAAGFGAEASVDFRVIFAPLVNDADHARDFADAAAGLVGEAKVNRNKPPANASEDFSFMLEKVPGAYINLGNGEDSAPVHNPAYNFNDAAIPYGVSLFASIVERKLPK
ncbi:MAG TPA: M20 aminoacylase family protein [Acetobacteraceae bacterium]|jgi:hippurate hydrolase|nr:M20 aminoacylase family protein [Acetobacteraceae bacterium]